MKSMNLRSERTIAHW